MTSSHVWPLQLLPPMDRERKEHIALSLGGSCLDYGVRVRIHPHRPHRLQRAGHVTSSHTTTPRGEGSSVNVSTLTAGLAPVHQLMAQLASVTSLAAASAASEKQQRFVTSLTAHY